VQRDQQAALTRKTSGQIFSDKMYTKQNLKHLSLAMFNRLTKPFEKMVEKQFETNGWMKKLISFYEEEVGSDGSDDDDDSSSESASASAKSSNSEKTEDADSKKSADPLDG